jgi:IclR family acetate operon transcriptional repressor
MESTSQRTGGVQSIERAFNLIETIVANGGVMGVSQLAAAVSLPPPTIHRLVRTLVDIGYLRQEPSRQYTLGPRILLFAESASAMLSSVARPHLAGLVEDLGETANLAVLDGSEIVYVAQVPSRHSMRMFTEVGRHVLPHCTAVGKALMADMDETDARALLTRTGMPKHTAHTIVEPSEFIAALRTTSQLGYALDEGEQEIGVRCVAVAVPDQRPRLAISISGPTQRMTDELVARAAPRLAAASRAIAQDLLGPRRETAER